MKEGKIRKFAYKKRTNTHRIQTLRPLYPLWILEGAGQYWPTPPDDPERIRVASVFELSVCSLSATSLEYPQRIEWSQCLNSVFVCSLFFVIKFSNFSLFHPSLIIQYSTEECSTVQLFTYYLYI